VRITNGFREGIKIPNKLINAIPSIADVLDISNPLPGRDDQKCLLSLMINTLNWLLKMKLIMTREVSSFHCKWK
jgi:hypothetical protein